MKQKLFIICTIIFCLSLMGNGCNYIKQDTLRPEEKVSTQDFPKIASWFAKKDQIIESAKPFDLVMTGWFEPEEAKKIKAQNPNALLLAGLTIGWTYSGDEWMQFLSTVANFGKEDPIEITEDMYLRDQYGKLCAFGWESEKWDHKEIYAMDPRNYYWVELITNFYKNTLAQPQHDGIIIDMVMEKSWCPEMISNQDWVEANKKILKNIQEINTKNKLVIFNSGRDLSQIDEYAEFANGYVMENFLGEWGATFDDGLAAADSGCIVIYAVDTDNTGEKIGLNRMRLGLALSLMNDNTYFAYDFGPRDHGQAWWFDEYDADLGQPEGEYYMDANAYFRKFENGVVVASPNEYIDVSFDEDMIDVTSGNKGMKFKVEKGDAKIFLKIEK